MPSGNSRIPYRGDGNPNQPEWRLPLTETRKSTIRSYGCMVFLFCIPFIFFIITAQNAYISLGLIAVILFVVILFFAMRDIQGIATIVDEDAPADKKDPALLADYLAQIEWKQTHRRNHPKEPEWQFRPTTGKVDNQAIGCWSSIVLLIIFIVPFVLTYFFGINSPISIIATVILGLVGILTYIIYQDLNN